MYKPDSEKWCVYVRQIQSQRILIKSIILVFLRQYFTCHSLFFVKIYFRRSLAIGNNRYFFQFEQFFQSIPAIVCFFVVIARIIYHYSSFLCINNIFYMCNDIKVPNGSVNNSCCSINCSPVPKIVTGTVITVAPFTMPHIFKLRELYITVLFS